MENITQTKKPATKIENDLKFVDGLKLDGNSFDNSATSSKLSEEKQKKNEVLIAEATSSTLNSETIDNPFKLIKEENQEKDQAEGDDIRKKRLQHFSSVQ